MFDILLCAPLCLRLYEIVPCLPLPRVLEIVPWAVAMTILCDFILRLSLISALFGVVWCLPIITALCDMVLCLPLLSTLHESVLCLSLTDRLFEIVSCHITH